MWKPPALKQFLDQLRFRNKVLASFLLGVASTLAMPPVALWPILFVTFPLFIWLIDGVHYAQSPNSEEPSKRKKLKQVFLLSWGFGFGYFVVSLYWLGSSFLVEPEKFAWALPFAVTLLPLFLGLFYAIPLALASLFWTKGAERLLLFSLAIFSGDWLRSHILTGFPWNLIGHSLTGQLEMMQSVTLFGLYGLSAIAALIFSTPAILFPPQTTESKGLSWTHVSPLIFSAIMLTGLYGFGAYKLEQVGPTKFLEDIEVVLIQPNISQRDKVDYRKRPNALLKTIELTETLPPLDETEVMHRLIIWPETAIPFALNRSPTILKRLDEMLEPGNTLISGAFHVEKNQEIKGKKNYQVYNSLFVVNHLGEITNHYDKNHLVPFGEYLPFPQLFRNIGLKAIADERGGFKIGPEPKPVHLEKAPPFLPSICYEAIFPLSEKTITTGAKWLLNISNDGWFGNTVGPHQHLHQVRLRSVETGLPMIRSVNGGISAIFDGLGRVVKKSTLNKSSVIRVKLPKNITLEKYIIPNELWSLLILLAFLVLISTEKILTNRSKFTSKH